MTHKTPDAYGLLDEGEVHYATPFRDEAEAALRRTGDKDSVIVALYRSPTLTDEEREAIEWFAEVRKPLSSFDDGEYVFTLRNLFERLGGER